jgi:hypothetical protein
MIRGVNCVVRKFARKIKPTAASTKPKQPEDDVNDLVRDLKIPRRFANREFKDDMKHMMDSGTAKRIEA